jgi:uncharacterized protein YbjT (DUF2867 family)
MASHRIGVFPASGGIGGGTVKHLLPRHPAKDLVFIARNPANLDFAAAAGATVRKADYDFNADLEHAFEDIDTLFLISYASVEVEHRAEVSDLSQWSIIANHQRCSVTELQSASLSALV